MMCQPPRGRPRIRQTQRMPQSRRQITGVKVMGNSLAICPHRPMGEMVALAARTRLITEIKKHRKVQNAASRTEMIVADLTATAKARAGSLAAQIEENLAVENRVGEKRVEMNRVGERQVDLSAGPEAG